MKENRTQVKEHFTHLSYETENCKRFSKLLICTTELTNLIYIYTFNNVRKNY